MAHKHTALLLDEHAGADYRQLADTRPDLDAIQRLQEAQERVLRTVDDTPDVRPACDVFGPLMARS